MKQAHNGDLVVWRDRGQKFWAAGIVTGVSMGGKVWQARIHTPLDGWCNYPINGTAKIASASTIRNLETLVQHAPVFEVFGDALNYFRLHRI